MRNLFISFGLSLTILGVNTLPTLAQSTHSYSRCQNNRSEYCLRKGDRGRLVRELISTLICVGAYPPVAIVDDVFTEEIERAVKNLQRDLGLVVDGIVGPQTRAMLEYGC